MSNLTTAGNLTVSGNETINGNTILGSSSSNSLIVNSNATFNNSLTCNNINTTGNISQTSNSTLSSGSGQVTLNGPVVISGSNSLTLGTGLFSNNALSSVYNGLMTTNNGIIINPNSSYIGNNNLFNSTAITNPLVANGLCMGTGDGASYTVFNLALNSWNSIGFVYSNPSGPSVCNCYINTRTGDINSKGNIIALNVYTTGNLFNNFTGGTALYLYSNSIFLDTYTANTLRYYAPSNHMFFINSVEKFRINSVDISTSNNINTTANLIVGGDFNLTGVMNSVVTMPTTTNTKNALGIYWNTVGGLGESDFLNYSQGGVGGFAFYNISSTTTPKLLAQIDNNGSIVTNNIKFNYNNSNITLDNTDATYLGFIKSINYNAFVGSSSTVNAGNYTVPTGVWLITINFKFNQSTRIENILIIYTISTDTSSYNDEWTSSTYCNIGNTMYGSSNFPLQVLGTPINLKCLFKVVNANYASANINLFYKFTRIG